jgi:ABC-type antimicrobial peptide transport system permease subunit
LRIVGVVPDVVTDVTVLQPLALYMPMIQAWPSTSRTLVVRAASDVDAAHRDLVAAVRQLDPQITYPPFLTMRERIGRQMGPQRFGVFILGALGFVAIVLTVVGTYVLAETLAALRMREMGIRAALGASGLQLGSIVIRETALLVGLALSAGLLLAWLGAGAIRSFLYHVQPLDPITLAATGAVILSLALAVSLRPAVRVARVHLTSVLRAE